jgi:hypothetical protein
MVSRHDGGAERVHAALSSGRAFLMSTTTASYPFVY